MFRSTGMQLGLVTGLLAAMANAQSVVTVRDLNPFTRVALVQADADLASIEFRGAKLVQVATQVRSATDGSYCEQQAFMDPGGSMFCPATELKRKVPAYEVTWSYTAPANASDESGGKYYTFAVYYRPEELSAAIREAISKGKGRGSELAALFDVKASAELQRRAAVDGNKSKFCASNLSDGAWVQSDPGCQDELSYKKAAVAPVYATVRIDFPLQVASSR